MKRQRVGESSGFIRKIGQESGQAQHGPNKLVPIDVLLELVTEAGLQHQRDFYETSLSNLLVQSGDPLGDLSTAYEIADSLGIPAARLTEAIENRYPPKNDQLSELEFHGAIATTGAVARTYRVELLHLLREALPSMHFEAEIETTGRLFDQPYLEEKWRRDYTVKFQAVTETESPVRSRGRWLARLVGGHESTPIEHTRRKVFLASVQVGNEYLPHLDQRRPRASDVRLHRGSRLHMVVTVGSGVFIRLCGQKLAELLERFRRHNGVSGHQVLYDYVVEESNQLT